MKLKLDENMPASLVDALASLGYDTDTVPQEQLAGKDDATVWAAAQNAERFLFRYPPISTGISSRFDARSLIEPRTPCLV